MLPAPMRVAVAILLILTAIVAGARAEPIVVQHYGLGVSNDVSGFLLTVDGFQVSAAWPTVVRSPLDDCRFCPPGTAIDLDAILGGSPTPGSLGGGSIEFAGGSAPVLVAGTFYLTPRRL